MFHHDYSYLLLEEYSHENYRFPGGKAQKNVPPCREQPQDFLTLRPVSNTQPLAFVKIKSKYANWFVTSAASTPGRQILTVTPKICLSLQIPGCQLALQPQFSYGSRRKD